MLTLDTRFDDFADLVQKLSSYKLIADGQMRYQNRDKIFRGDVRSFRISDTSFRIADIFLTSSIKTGRYAVPGIVSAFCRTGL